MDRSLFAQGVLDRTSGVTDFYVATPQLFHFALQVDALSTTEGAVVGRIFNEQGDVVHQIIAAAGSTQTAGSVLLNPGSYRFAAFSLIATADTAAALHYSLLGQSVFSDPFGDLDPVAAECGGVQVPRLVRRILLSEWNRDIAALLVGYLPAGLSQLCSGQSTTDHGHH